METGQSLRVMVADDSVLFREGVARLLVEAGFAVTARVGDAPALLECVREDPPDVAIVDIRMPPTHTTEGLDAARTLREKHPEVGVLVLSAHVEPQYALQLLESGADRVGLPAQGAAGRSRGAVRGGAADRGGRAGDRPLGGRPARGPQTHPQPAGRPHRTRARGAGA